MGGGERGGCRDSWTRAFDVVSPTLHDQCTFASPAAHGVDDIAGLAIMDLALQMEPIRV